MKKIEIFQMDISYIIISKIKSGFGIYPDPTLLKFHSGEKSNSVSIKLKQLGYLLY